MFELPCVVLALVVAKTFSMGCFFGFSIGAICRTLLTLSLIIKAQNLGDDNASFLENQCAKGAQAAAGSPSHVDCATSKLTRPKNADVR